VAVQFYAADPRNNHRNQGTFLSVDLQQPNGTWKMVFVDGHWETKYHWQRIESIWLGESMVTISWDIPQWAQSGLYRITYYGDKRDIFGTITPFNATTSSFSVN